MSQTKKTRRLAPWKLRKALAELAEIICSGRELIAVDLTGNTFGIHLDGGSISITVTPEGGAL